MTSTPELTARYSTLLDGKRYAWRFFLGRLMIGGWVLSELQHQRLLQWAKDVDLSLTEESDPRR